MRLSGREQRKIRLGWLKRERGGKKRPQVSDWCQGEWGRSSLGGRNGEHQGSCKVIEERGLTFFSLDIKYPYRKRQKL